MSDKKTIIADRMVEARLIETSNKLNISLDDLIERYISRELFTDDYYVPRQLTGDEFLEMSMRDVERDKKRGIFPKKRDSDVFIGRWNED